MAAAARPPVPRDREAGVTLVETLLALAVAGVLAGLVSLGLGRLGAPDAARTEAVRLARVLEAEADRALAGGRDRGLDWTETGYATAGGAVRRLPPGLSLWRSDGGAGSGGTVRLSGNGTAGAATLRVVGGRTAWTVAFDGLRARVAPEAAP